jgi:hypothetical protein
VISLVVVVVVVFWVVFNVRILIILKRVKYAVFDEALRFSWQDYEDRCPLRCYTVFGRQVLQCPRSLLFLSSCPVCCAHEGSRCLFAKLQDVTCKKVVVFFISVI